MATVFPIPSTLGPDILKTASDCIHGNGVLAIATESFYALAAGVQHPEAIRKIIEMKGDRGAKPILLLVGSKPQVLQVASHIPPAGELLMDRLWPGPLTLILPAASDLPVSLTGGSGTIGVRQPGQRQLLQILGETGPLTGTSANRSGMVPATTSKEILQEFKEGVDVILDSGPSPGGSPSTLLSLVDGVHLLRQGPISAEVIQEILNTLNLQIQDASPRS